jgi:hypothetical protein
MFIVVVAPHIIMVVTAELMAAAAVMEIMVVV